MMIASTSAPSCMYNGTLTTRMRPLNVASSSKQRRKEAHVCRADAGDAGSDKGGNDSAESLFMRELKRRGLSSKSAETKRRTQIEAPPKAPPEEQSRSQLEVSRALNSEGLEGLIPRGKELLKLGLSFFLAFGPLILGITALAGTLYFLFGSEFVHGGRTSMAMPRYVDPYELLGQPTVDPTVPFRQEQVR